MQTGGTVQDPKNFVIYGWPLTEAKYLSTTLKYLFIVPIFVALWILQLVIKHEFPIPDMA